jgi:hypothetical protein
VTCYLTGQSSITQFSDKGDNSQPVSPSKRKPILAKATTGVTTRSANTSYVSTLGPNDDGMLYFDIT